MIDLIKEIPWQIFLFVFILLLYFLLDAFFPKNKQKTEEDEIKRSKRKRNNYTKRTYTTIREPKHDRILPTDGTSIHQAGASGYKKIDKTKKTQETLDRLEKYQQLLDKERITNLNTLAKRLKIINSQAVSDIKFFKSKKKLFLNVIIDEINCKISYTDDYEEFINDIDDENSEDDLQSIEIIDDEHIKCKCPKCNTINIAGINDNEYRCFYCLNKIKIEK